MIWHLFLKIRLQNHHVSNFISLSALLIEQQEMSLDCLFLHEVGYLKAEIISAGGAILCAA